MTTQNNFNETTLNTIVAFHIGRGGRFNNAGHRTFIGQRKIGDFTNDLFATYENVDSVSAAIGDRENLREKFEDAISGIPEALNFFERIGLPLGEVVYADSVGSLVGLTESEVESGIGRINIDNNYNTTYACYLKDCDENELKIMRESSEWHWLDADVKAYILQTLGVEEETEEQD